MNMARAMHIALATLLAAMTAGAGEFTVEFRSYRVLGPVDGGFIRQLAAAMPAPADQDVVLGLVEEAVGLASVFDDLALAMHGSHLAWNGEPEPRHSRVRQVAAARIEADADQRYAMVNEAQAPPEYLVHKGGGLYERVTADTVPGVQVDVHVAPDAAPDSVRLTLEFRMTYVTGRAPLEGVALNVGKPDYMVQKWDMPMEMPLGQWRCLVTRQAQREDLPGPQYVLHFIRVAPASERADSHRSYVAEGGFYRMPAQAWQAVAGHVTPAENVTLTAGEYQAFRSVAAPEARAAHAAELLAYWDRVDGVELISAPRVTVTADPAKLAKFVVKSDAGQAGEALQMQRAFVPGLERLLDTGTEPAQGRAAIISDTSVHGEGAAREMLGVGLGLRIGLESHGRVPIQLAAQNKWLVDSGTGAVEAHPMECAIDYAVGEPLFFVTDQADGQTLLFLLTVKRAAPPAEAASPTE